MSENQEPEYLYLTSIGRKSGKPHQIEIWFVQYHGSYYAVSEAREQSDWVQNIIATPTVTISLGSRDAAQIDGAARVVDPETEPELTQAVTALMNTKYQWGEGTIVEIKPPPTGS